MMAAVFSMQGLGQLGGALVMLCLTAGFKDSLSTAVATTNPKTTPYQNCVGECAVSVDKMWRALIGMCYSFDA
jgi:PHS family inorganic phosphate transporter-like MFS transporter